MLPLFKLYNKITRIIKTSWHTYLYAICSRLHIISIANIIEVILYKNPYIFELNVSRFAAGTSGNLFIDVGSCCGRYVILLGYKYKKLIAIEPHPENMRIIKNNVRYGSLKNVEYLQLAISDKNGYAELYQGINEATHRIFEDPLKKEEKIRIKTSTMATVMKQHVADLIKVDVEGAEWLVLKGAEEIIDKVKSWIIELHNPKRKMELEKWFTSHDYSVQWLDLNHIYASRTD